jgi:hypothetical protein
VFSKVKKLCVDWKIVSWARGVTQAVECLPSKCEILDSNLSTTKNKNK